MQQNKVYLISWRVNVFPLRNVISQIKEMSHPISQFQRPQFHAVVIQKFSLTAEKIIPLCYVCKMKWFGSDEDI